MNTRTTIITLGREDFIVVGYALCGLHLLIHEGGGPFEYELNKCAVVNALGGPFEYELNKCAVVNALDDAYDTLGIESPHDTDMDHYGDVLDELYEMLGDKAPNTDDSGEGDG